MVKQYCFLGYKMSFLRYKTQFLLYERLFQGKKYFYKLDFFLLQIGKNSNDKPPNTIIIKVCADHTIHPKALLGSSEILNNVKAITTASGKDPIPPLVAAILKLAKINPIKTVPKVIPCNSGSALVVIKNMHKYITQMNTVWKRKGHFFFILKILSVPSIRPFTNFLTFKAIEDELVLINKKKILRTE